MKLLNCLPVIAACFCAGLSFAAPAPDVPPDSTTSNPPPAKENTLSPRAALIFIEIWGWNAAQEQKLTVLQLNKEEFQVFERGILAATQGKPAPEDLEKIRAQTQSYLQQRAINGLALIKARMKTEAETFFANIKKRPGVQILPSGLAYEIIQPGQGPVPRPEQTVAIRFKIILLNGRVVDESKTEMGDSKPLKQMMPGVMEGLQKIGKGGAIRLYIPPQLGAGEEGAPNIPPNATLVYETELLDITDNVAAAGNSK